MNRPPDKGFPFKYYENLDRHYAKVIGDCSNPGKEKQQPKCEIMSLSNELRCVTSTKL